RVVGRAAEAGPRLGLGFNGADRGLAHLEAQPGFGAAPRVTIQRGEVCFGRPRSDRLADRHVVPGVPAPVDPHPGVEIELSEVAIARPPEDVLAPHLPGPAGAGRNGGGAVSGSGMVSGPACISRTRGPRVRRRAGLTGPPAA